MIPKYLFVSAGRVSGEDGVRHLLHNVRSQALQHVLLVGSLKEETKQVVKKKKKKKKERKKKKMQAIQ